jgi:hypothetical protein
LGEELEAMENEEEQGGDSEGEVEDVTNGHARREERSGSEDGEASDR